MDRMVLVNWNGGVVPTFSQDLPEPGTVFRLTTTKATPGQTFTFRAEQPGSILLGPLDNAAFLRYVIIDKGSKSFDDFFISLWLDPDLGGSADDLVACDTLLNLFYCYNATNFDNDYGSAPPAVGFRVLEGPVIPSPGDTAIVNGRVIPDYRNLGLYAFNKYINGTDPDSYAESYCYMQGLDAKSGCLPYNNPTNGQPTRFVCSGDPVAHTGWIDSNPSDRRMMASFGPFTFNPGDSQTVLFKMGVGSGNQQSEFD